VRLRAEHTRKDHQLSAQLSPREPGWRRRCVDLEHVGMPVSPSACHCAAIPVSTRLRAGSSGVEHVTFNHVVEGSNPSRLTNEIKGLRRNAT
jgi:hypothetical protein